MSSTRTFRHVDAVPSAVYRALLEFGTADPGLRGEMTVTTSLTPAGGGTDVLVVHDGIPTGARRRQRNGHPDDPGQARLLIGG